MTVNETLRLMAGTFVIASVALGHYVSPWFFLFTGFVGLNLVQSAFTRWCPAMAILRNLGVRDPECEARLKPLAVPPSKKVRK